MLPNNVRRCFWPSLLHLPAKCINTSSPSWFSKKYLTMTQIVGNLDTRHHTTFNNPAYRSETTLADYIWDLQCPDRCYMWGAEECENSIEYEITWKILARIQPHNRNVPTVLKRIFFILFHPKTASLNKKTEIFQGCKHKMFKFLADCKVTWSPWMTTWPRISFSYHFTFISSVF